MEARAWFFSRRSFVVYLGMVHVSWESTYKIDSVLLWAFIQLHCLSVANQCWWCCKVFIIRRELWPALTLPQLAIHCLEPISLPLPTQGPSVYGRLAWTTNLVLLLPCFILIVIIHQIAFFLHLPPTLHSHLHWSTQITPLWSQIRRTGQPYTR